MSAKDIQVAGNHYKDMAIQPFEFGMANELNYFQSHVLGYLVRYPHKGTPIDDIRKMRHLCALELERLGEKVE